MKRPSDSQIRNWKIGLGIVLVITGIIAFQVQNLEVESTLFGIELDQMQQMIVQYSIIGIGILPIILGGLNLHFLKSGKTKILQIVFGIILIYVSTLFKETASLGVDIVYFLIGLGIIIVGITGKFITKK